MTEREQPGTYGECDGCQRRDYRIKYRGRMLCRKCLYPDDKPLDVVDYMRTEGNLARWTNSKRLEYGGLLQALDKTMQKHGIKMDDFVTHVDR